MTPRDPDFEARCRRLFHQQGIMGTLGGTVEAVGVGSCVLAAPITPSISQQHGYAHAGLAWTMGDSACGFAAQTLLAPTQDVLTIEMKINLLAPAQGACLVAEGRVIRAGRRISSTAAEVYAEAGGERIHVATLLGTMMIMEGLA